MNIPKTIESALIDALQSFAIGGKTVVRSWRNLQKDQKWTPLNDRTFPCIDIRATPPKSDQTTATACTCEVQIQVFTHLADDQSHATINSIEEAVQECLDTLYAEHRSGATTGIYKTFTDAIEADCAGVSIGGVYIGDPLPPDDDGEGHNYLGLTLIVSYSRSDFN